MDSAALVSEAAGWANDMVLREARGPGDLPRAMKRISHRYGIPHGTLWALRYRPPKDIFASAYFKLRAAYQAECSRQMEKLRNDLERTRAIAGPDSSAVRAAEALLRSSAGVAEG